MSLQNLAWSLGKRPAMSSPSTPSPPAAPRSSPPSVWEATLRKRKLYSGHVPVPVEELWEVLSAVSGMQRHVHLVHLGRQAEPEQNDGEEDFYYTELYVGMDKLTNRLSSLTPVSPTVSMPPTFPHVEFSELLEPPVLPNLPHPLTLFPSPKLSSSAVPQVCHSDQAYQQGEATDEDGGRSQSTLERNRTGVVTPSRDAWLPTTWSHSPLRPKPTYQPCLLSLGSSWKPWGDSKKCWKVYGVDHRDLCIQPAAGRKSASSSWTEPIP